MDQLFQMLQEAQDLSDNETITKVCKALIKTNEAQIKKNIQHEYSHPENTKDIDQIFENVKDAFLNKVQNTANAYIPKSERMFWSEISKIIKEQTKSFDSIQSILAQVYTKIQEGQPYKYLVQKIAIQFIWQYRLVISRYHWLNDDTVQIDDLVNEMFLHVSEKLLKKITTVLETEKRQMDVIDIRRWIWKVCKNKACDFGRNKVKANKSVKEIKTAKEIKTLIKTIHTLLDETCNEISKIPQDKIYQMDTMIKKRFIKIFIQQPNFREPTYLENAIIELIKTGLSYLYCAGEITGEQMDELDNKIERGYFTDFIVDVANHHINDWVIIFNQTEDDHLKLKHPGEIMIGEDGKVTFSENSFSESTLTLCIKAVLKSGERYTDDILTWLAYCIEYIKNVPTNNEWYLNDNQLKKIYNDLNRTIFENLKDKSYFDLLEQIREESSEYLQFSIGSSYDSSKALLQTIMYRRMDKRRSEIDQRLAVTKALINDTMFLQLQELMQTREQLVQYLEIEKQHDRMKAFLKYPVYIIKISEDSQVLIEQASHYDFEQNTCQFLVCQSKSTSQHWYYIRLEEQNIPLIEDFDHLIQQTNDLIQQSTMQNNPSYYIIAGLPQFDKKPWGKYKVRDKSKSAGELRVAFNDRNKIIRKKDLNNDK